MSDILLLWWALPSLTLVLIALLGERFEGRSVESISYDEWVSLLVVFILYPLGYILLISHSLRGKDITGWLVKERKWWWEK